MLKAKKVDFRSIALLVVSVMLVMSLSLAGTMAWFGAADSADSPDIVLGQPIGIQINEDAVSGGSPDKVAGEFDIVLAADELLPGMKVAPNLAVDFTGSTTPALLRVQLTASVTGGTGEADPVQLTTDIQAGLRLSVMRLITPPFPAASRPSNKTTSLSPLAFPKSSTPR